MKSDQSFHPTYLRLLLILVACLVSMCLPVSAHAQSAQVHVILFYSPFCGHCHRVISEELPPIVQTYNTSYVWSYFGDPPNEETGQLPGIVAFEGDVLQILYVDTSSQVGNDLYSATVERLQIPPERQAVPTMVVGEELLIGGIDIPAQLPGLVDQWLAEGGLSWPDIPGLEEIISSLVLFPDQVQETPTQAPEAAPTDQVATTENPGAPDPSTQDPSFEFDASDLSVIERIQLDPLGNSLSIIVLIGMIFSLIGVGLRWRLPISKRRNIALPIAIPLLILVGILIAAYLGFVETTGIEAVCGPVGDCNTVQSSKYAMLFGIMPVGVLGIIGYLGLLVAWFLAQRSSAQFSTYAFLAFFGMASGGTIFSTYLTFLEPFIIGATCMWCLSSAVIMTMMMLLSVDQARVAYARLRAGRR
jgi:uncharacterized membrane protein